MPDPTLEERIKKAAEKAGITGEPKTSTGSTKKSGLSDEALLKAFGGNTEKKSPVENEEQPKQETTTSSEGSSKPVPLVALPSEKSITNPIQKTPAEQKYKEFIQDKTPIVEKPKEDPNVLKQGLSPSQEAQIKARLKPTEESGKEHNPLTTIYKGGADFITNQIPKMAAGAAAELISAVPAITASGQMMALTGGNNEQTKKNLINYAHKQQEESQKETGNLVKSLSDIRDWKDLGNYLAYNISQAGVQIPLAVGTAGVSSAIQESSNHYLEGIEEIAKRKGITPEQVIEQNLDKPATAIATGILSGALDYAGAKNVSKAINYNNVFDTIKAKALSALKSSGTEGATEAGQSVVGQISKNVQAGDNASEAVSKIDPKQVLEEGVAGAVGAGGLHAVSSTVNKISELTVKKKNLEADINNPAISDEAKQVLEKERDATDLELDKAKQEVHDEHEKVVEAEKTPAKGGITAEPVVNKEEIAPPPPENKKSEDQTEGNVLQEEPIKKEVESTAEEKKSKVTPKEEKQNEQTETVLPTGKGEESVPRETDKQLESKELNKESSSKDLTEGDNKPSEEITKENPVEKTESEQPEKERKFSQQILNDPEISDDIKKGLSEDAKKYIPVSNEITNKEAQAIVKEKGLENSLHDLMNTENGIKPRVRVTLGEAIIKQANQALKDNPQDKEAHLKTALDAASFTAKHLTELGQGVQAAAIYNKLSPEGLIRHAQNIVREHRTKALEKHEPEIKTKEEALNKINEQIVNKLLDVKDIKELIDSKEEGSLKKRKRAAAKEAVDFLESLKVNTKGKALDATYGIAAELYNGAISIVQASIKAGDSISKAISKGIAHIKKNHAEEWDEKGFRAHLESPLEKHNTILDPEKAIKAELKNLNTSIKEVIKKHYTKAEDIKTSLVDKLVKQSGLEEQEAKDLADEISKKFNDLATKAKRDYIKQKSPKDLKEVVNKVIPSSVDQQLIEMSNVGALTNEDVRNVYAEKLGIKDITTEEAERIIKLGEIMQEADNFADETKENFTTANVEKYIKLKKEQQKAINEIAELLSDKKPKSVADTLSTVLQGNLLTPISILTNVYSNTLLQPLRFAAKGIASTLDYGFTKAFGKPRAIDVLAANKGYWVGAKAGLKQGTRELLTGPQSDEIKKFDIGRGFKPVKALIAAFDKKKQQTTSERINNFVEGTVGMPAEAFFRALNFGDKPAEVAAQTAKAYELAALKGLKGTEREKFLMFPDEESAEQIKQAGESATFKEGNVAAKAVSYGQTQLFNWADKNIPNFSGALKLFVKSQMPFVKTPLNIIKESFDYALPQLSLVQSMWYGSKGNRVKAEEYFGKAMVGFILHAAADALFRNGLLSGGPEEDKKERALQYQAFNAKGLNLSGLMRLLTGGDPSIQEKDTFIQYDKMGIPGNILNMRAEMGEKKEGKEFDNFATELLYDTFSSMPNIAGTALEQSFLAGTSTLLEAIKSGEWDNWMSNTFGAITSIPIPNTVASIARANREYIPEVRDPDIMKRLGNVLKAKVGMVNGLPVKIDLWGNPIKQTPSGVANPYVYHLIDVTKARDITSDKLSYEVYKVWKATDDKDVIPSVPSQTINVGKLKIKLTPQQYERFLKDVGGSRKALGFAFINNDGYDKTTNETKIETFKRLYTAGAKIGKRQFLINELKRNSKFLIENQDKK